MAFKYPEIIERWTLNQLEARIRAASQAKSPKAMFPPSSSRALARRHSDRVVHYVARHLRLDGHKIDPETAAAMKRAARADLLFYLPDAIALLPDVAASLVRARKIAREATGEAIHTAISVWARRGKHPRYRWVTQLDRRVRPEHRALHGKTFLFRRGHPVEGHPGKPWGCRCVAVPA